MPCHIHTDHGSYESLHDDECGRLLDSVARKDDGFVSRAAAMLTPLVQALYDGEDYAARLRLEDVDNISGESMSPVRILELCQSVDDTQTGTSSLPCE